MFKRVHTKNNSVSRLDAICILWFLIIPVIFKYSSYQPANLGKKRPLLIIEHEGSDFQMLSELTDSCNSSIEVNNMSQYTNYYDIGYQFFSVIIVSIIEKTPAHLI